ncbi:MAG TPA: PEP-CTERM sorting domain-containing protein [Bryobacteraceae bacterium]|jgi:hypothetical protein
MKHYLKIVLPVMLAALARGTPSACVATTYTAYEALGSGGCTVGNELFSNFSALSFSNSLGVPTISTDDILITPSTAASIDSLAFTYQNLPATANQTATVVGVGNSQLLAYNFNYIITPNLNPVVDIQMETTLLNTNAAGVSAVKDASNGGPVQESSSSDGGTSHASLSLVTGPVTALSGGGAFNVLDAISLQGQNGVAQQSNFTNLFTEGALATTPEPGPVLLIGSGLVCLGLSRRQFRRK